MKLRNLIDKAEAVAMLTRAVKKPKVSFKISMATKELRQVYNLFIDERNKLIKEYAEPQPDGSSMVPLEKRPAYQRELDEIADEEVDDIPFVIRLADIEDVEIDGNVIAMLADNIRDGE